MNYRNIETHESDMSYRELENHARDMNYGAVPVTAPTFLSTTINSSVDFVK